jgi:hypothetical protein
MKKKRKHKPQDTSGYLKESYSLPANSVRNASGFPSKFLYNTADIPICHVNLTI